MFVSPKKTIAGKFCFRGIVFSARKFVFFVEIIPATNPESIITARLTAVGRAAGRSGGRPARVQLGGAGRAAGRPASSSAAAGWAGGRAAGNT